MLSKFFAVYFSYFISSVEYLCMCFSSSIVHREEKGKVIKDIERVKELFNLKMRVKDLIRKSQNILKYKCLKENLPEENC